MEYAQNAMRDATLGVFYSVLIVLFFAYFPKVIEIIQEILEVSDPSAPLGDNGADIHGQKDR